MNDKKCGNCKHGTVDEMRFDFDTGRVVTEECSRPELNEVVKIDGKMVRISEMFDSERIGCFFWEKENSNER